MSGSSCPSPPRAARSSRSPGSHSGELNTKKKNTLRTKQNDWLVPLRLQTNTDLYINCSETTVESGVTKKDLCHRSVLSSRTTIYCRICCTLRYLIYGARDLPPSTVPKVINFPQYNGQNEILGGIFHVVSRFPLHFVLYHGNLDYFLDSVVTWALSTGLTYLTYTRCWADRGPRAVRRGRRWWPRTWPPCCGQAASPWSSGGSALSVRRP